MNAGVSTLTGHLTIWQTVHMADVRTGWLGYTWPGCRFRKEGNMNRDIIRRMVQVLSTLLVEAAILLGAAGTVRWNWAWVFLLLSVANLVINLRVLPAELIEERGRKKEDAKSWDKTLTSLNVIPILLMYVCCGLDYRFNWSGSVPIAVNIAGLVVTFSGSMLFTWAMVSNKYFSTLVRLQFDRQHAVASGGPYQYVRHPGYVGYIAMCLGTPIALGRLWGLAFGAITAVLFIVRTILEDNTLKEELPGYAQYADKVKYRLMPFVW
jgi:protein-S-isoprenylcysteine O-methyltransferase Ste14